MVALGLGADGVCPYVMVEVALMDGYADDISNLASALRKGSRSSPRSASTRCAATRSCSPASGSSRSSPRSSTRPPTSPPRRAAWGSLSSTPTATSASASSPRTRTPSRPRPSLLPQGLQGGRGRRQRGRQLRGVLGEGPPLKLKNRSLRHILDLESDRDPVASASAEVGLHDYPIVISSMSFGSQGEVAYRAYAEAAKRVNIIAMNGEGGEIQDLYGKYPLWRGQQVASGPLQRDQRDDQLLLPGRDQDRPGRQPGEAAICRRKVRAKVAQISSPPART